MATPTPARSTADAARLYARDGLFWMRDVLTAAEIEELRADAGASFAEVLRALLVQHAMAEAAGRDPPPARYAEVSQRDGARYDSRHGFSGDGPALAIACSFSRENVADKAARRLKLAREVRSKAREGIEQLGLAGTRKPDDARPRGRRELRGLGEYLVSASTSLAWSARLTLLSRMLMIVRVGGHLSAAATSGVAPRSPISLL